mmetsp:Transcript_37016/g.59933  ORF Transcript_37016/g.59933 Transcript_37016/m.59933 type:complete len:189 (-) Transcript_37016:191-757(-)|eukprot:CAMPEP_0184675724 /NCGR_PEP_ID=MMETSP0308-20130426/87946_1 /TAXON_ID=38269 /ORGANISM="Gloeochaete witrockiana, Strain SAG 46.84" /LENGTH=188 /DNA_ID=CAMNT_0027123461 /DNA_START=31 /DNA_END=597 /DNA_ORIENTATION=+
MSVLLNTTHGAITVKLFCKETPRTSRNFIELSKSGYYDGVIFHRVIPDFMCQSGDPLGDGTGGESIYGPTFEDEITAKLSHDRKGVISMANAGRNTNSSQFFFTFRQCPHLDGKHTVFGYVTDESLPVLDEIQSVRTDKNNRPIKDVKIFTSEVIDDPWDGEPLPPGAAVPEKPLIKEKAKKEQCVLQ